MVRSANTPFLVEVLEGRLAGASFPLEGRSAPYGAGAGGSISYGVAQRTKLVWNQGNPVATHLVFGPTLDPTTINGIWKERLLGEDVPIDLVETFENLCVRGLQTRVSWSTIERIGIIKHFVWHPGDPVGGLGDIRWEMTFEWSRPGGLSRLFVPTVGNTRKPFRDGLSDLAARFGRFRSLVNGFIFDVGSFAGNVRAVASNTVSQLESLLDTGQTIANFVTDTAGRLGGADDEGASDLLEQGSVSSDALIDNLSGTVELLGSLDPLNTTSEDGVQAVVSVATAVSALNDSAYDLIAASYATQVELEADLTPESEIEIPAVPGADLRRVARVFYGASDDWPRIAKANGIENGSTIPEDVFTLVIPIGLPAALDNRIGAC